MTVPQGLLNLAPEGLPVHRQFRYDGGNYGVALADFGASDQAIVRRIYRVVKETSDLWLSLRSAPDWPRLRQALLRLAEPNFFTAVRELGAATARRHTDLVRKVIHDVRGGALTGLMGLAQLLQARPDESLVRLALPMARDHGKIMRNAVVDLDPPTRAADEADMAHGIDHFLDKWHDAVIPLEGRTVAVGVCNWFHGSITARCLETAAIDRILYNCLNNAARFTADGRVVLSVFAVGDGRLVRWVVENALSDDQRDWLQRTTGGDLKRLFRGGYTRGGEGLGLTNCADFVAACFGLAGAAEAVDAEYLGARVLGGHYYTWFHWPALQTEPASLA